MDTPFADATGGDLQPSAPRAPAVIRVFVGPNGIRAGWRLLLFLAIAAVFGSILGSLVHRFGPRSQGSGLTAEGVLLSEGTVLAALLLSAVVMARIERRSLAQYALPGRSAFGRRFWLGVVWGFFGLTVLLVLIDFAHGFSFGALALHGSELFRYACLWAVAFLVIAFVEEFLFRGYALFTLSTGIGFWPSAILLSAVFGAVHIKNGGETWVGALAAASIGLFFCFTLRRTGSLWFAIGLHFMWDYSESFIYSVPDSGVVVTGHLLNSSIHGAPWLTGGSVGPEASAFVFIIIALFFILFDRLYRDVQFPLVSFPLSQPPSRLLAALDRSRR